LSSCEDRRDDREPRRRGGSVAIRTQQPELMAHGQPNLIMAVLLIGDVKMLHTYTNPQIDRPM
jgi:hypothetical protein